MDGSWTALWSEPLLWKSGGKPPTLQKNDCGGLEKADQKSAKKEKLVRSSSEI
ncbi:MAG: hypothetical protein ACJAQT_004746 [Akkermansiaceae bacterium]|jgi:hypothetical protein